MSFGWKFHYTIFGVGTAKQRYKIEAKNNALKNVNGYDRATSYGIENMQMKGALAIFSVNLERIIKLIS